MNITVRGQAPAQSGAGDARVPSLDESARRELQLLEEQLCDQKNVNLCLLNAEHL